MCIFSALFSYSGVPPVQPAEYDGGHGQHGHDGQVVGRPDGHGALHSHCKHKAVLVLLLCRPT